MILVVLLVALSPFFVFASSEDPVIDGMVTVSNNGVTISAKVVEHCTYKPDTYKNGSIWNDGYKICEAIIEGYNPNNYILTPDIFKFELDKLVDVKGQKYEYYFSNQSELYNETILNITEVEYTGPDGNPMIRFEETFRNVTRRRFTNWTLLADPKGMTYNNENFAYKVKFEFPQYGSASYNFTISYKKIGSTEIDIFLDPDITACGILGTAGATYTQTANIVNDTLDLLCIWITAENIIYDGRGYTIRSTNNKPGIYTEQFNTTIQHTDVSVGSDTQGYGIWLASGAHNSTVYNNTLSNQYFGIAAISSDYHNITMNTMNSDTVGIYLSGSDFNQVKGNIMGTAGGYGFYTVSGATSNSIYNNTVDSYNLGGILISNSNIVSNNTLTGNGRGVEVQGDSNIIENNTITYTGRGIYLSGADYNKITGNTISNTSADGGSTEYGISLESSSSYTLIANNTLFSAENGILISIGNYNNITNNTVNFGRNGIRIDNNNHTRLVNNNINNQTHYSIYVGANSYWSIFINTTVDIHSDVDNDGAILFKGASSHNIFQNCNFTTNQSIIISLVSNSANNTFLNCTYSAVENVTEGSQLIRKWYFDAQVNFTHNDTAVPDANITALNLSSSLQFSVLSGATGAIVQQSLIEYINTSTATYYNNHTINGTLINWNTNSPDSYSINITSNILQQFNITDFLAPNVSIDDPKAQTYSTNDSLALNYIVADEGIGIDSCWYKIINSTSDLLVDNVTLPTCANITFNITQGEGTYNLTVYANDSANNLDSDEVQFAISLTGPAVVLDAPIDDSYLSNGTDIYFNMTATDPDGISTCQLWGNWTGTWHKNYTWIGLHNATMNWTTQNISEGGPYKWNTWCNDTSDNGNWALNNLTFIIDETNPNVTIVTANDTTVSDTLSITINYSISDTNLDDCYFTLKTTGGLLHNYPENTSISCVLTSRSIATLAYGTYVFQLWGEDKAGNLDNKYLTFTTRATPPSGGGGAAPSVEGEEEEEKSFCGDGLCQPEGNDYGINEDYWNCASDCPGFDFDALMFSFTKYCWDRDNSTVCFWSQMLFATVPGVEEGANVTTIEDGKVCFMGVCERISGKTIFTNCLDGDPNPCFFDANLGFLVLFGTGIGLFAVSFIKLKSPGEVKKINPYKYVYIRAKKFGKKRRR